MALTYKAGNFQLNTVTGSQSVTGVGFQPKGVLFFHQPNTVAIGVPQLANWYHMVGMYDGTNQNAMWTHAPNGNAGLENVGFMHSSYAIVGGNNFSTVWAAQATSLNADGFTINITAAPPDVYWVGYLAFGGADLEFICGNVTLSTAGSQSFTGFGFQPTGLIMHTVGQGNAFSAGAVPDFTAADLRASFGFSDGTLQRSAGFAHRDGGVTVKLNARLQRNDAIIGCPNYNTSATTFQASLTSFNVDGFTLNNVTNNSNLKCLFLAVGGAQTKVGNYTTPAVTGVSNAASGLAFTPEAVVLATSNQSVFNTSQGYGSVPDGQGAEYSYGFATSNLNQFSIEAAGRDFTTTTIYGHYSHNIFGHANYVYNNLSGLEERVAFDSFQTDGFDINANTVLGSGNSVVSYLALEGDMAPPTPPSDPTGGSGDPNSPDSIFLDQFIGV
jgi:hypothetical protein